MPVITRMSFKLHGYENEVKVVDKVFNESILWTRHTGWSMISLDSASHYQLELDSTGIPNYITKNYHIGIEVLNLKMTLSRGMSIRFLI